ncbi:MAG: hypothetical protein HN402_07765 [Candidatus Scalindua sp.]|nr:hypothetical protein [Candidatus Scalindua sp.]
MYSPPIKYNGRTGLIEEGRMVLDSAEKLEEETVAYMETFPIMDNEEITYLH